MNRSRRAMLVVIPPLLTAVGSGCSFVFSHAPPAGHEQLNEFTCTESNAAPIVDLGFAGLSAAGTAGAIAALGDRDSEDPWGLGGLHTAAIVGGIASIAFYSAAAVPPRSLDSTSRSDVRRRSGRSERRITSS